MNGLPPGWTKATLGDIVLSIKNGIFVSRPKIEPVGVPILRISSVRPLKLDLADIRYSESSVGHLKDAGALLEEGDLLFTRYNGNPDYVGACARVPVLNNPLTYPDKLIRVRVDERVCDSRFLMFAFASPLARHQVRKVSRTTAGQIGISGASLRQIDVPLPPLSEQYRIVAALEDYLSRLDAARFELDKTAVRSARLHSDIRESVLRPWSANTTQFGLILREPLANGRSVQTDPDGFPVLRLTALSDGYLDLGERKGGEWTFEEAKPFLVRKGDFFISRGNGSLSRVGRGALLATDPDPVAFPDTLIRARVNELRLLPDFLRLIWDSRGIRRQIESAARTTAGIYKINQQIIEQLRIPIPPVQNQERIVAEFDAISSKVLHARHASVSSVTRADELCRSLLVEAFYGHLVTQDPADEPAQVLLNRIRAGRVALPRAARGRRATLSRQEETLL
jgi:type I restriction enzyme, S subunit